MSGGYSFLHSISGKWGFFFYILKSMFPHFPTVKLIVFSHNLNQLFPTLLLEAHQQFTFWMSPFSEPYYD